MEANVDVTSGEIISVEKSWWSFITSEAKENSSDEDEGDNSTGNMSRNSGY